jgi:methyl-accepting chemotaxis protein
MNNKNLHTLTKLAAENKGATLPHAKQATNGADTKLLTEIQRVTNATSTAVTQMNNNVTAIKASTSDNADALDEIDGTTKATIADTARLLIDTGNIATIVNTLSLSVNDIAADVSALENTDITDIETDLSSILEFVDETNATTNATAIAIAALDAKLTTVQEDVSFLENTDLTDL